MDVSWTLQRSGPLAVSPPRKSNDLPPLSSSREPVFLDRQVSAAGSTAVIRFRGIGLRDVRNQSELGWYHENKALVPFGIEGFFYFTFEREL